MENAALVGRLADHRAVCGNNELHVRKPLLEPESYRSLPFRMEVRVHLVHEHDAGMRNRQVSVDIP